MNDRLRGNGSQHIVSSLKSKHCPEALTSPSPSPLQLIPCMRMVLKRNDAYISLLNDNCNHPARRK